MAPILDLRCRFGAVRDQGLRSTCLAFAVAAVHEHARGNPLVTLSVETLYWAAKQLDGDSHLPGTTLEAADMALQRWGQPPEALWPYDPARADHDESYSPPAGVIDSPHRRFAAIASVPTDPWIVEGLLEEGTATAIGFPTWPGIRRLRGAHLAIPQRSELEADHHVMVAVGYRSDTNEVLLRNSWGLSWGDGGHAWIAASFIADHANAAWRLDPTAVSARSSDQPVFGADDAQPSRRHGGDTG